MLQPRTTSRQELVDYLLSKLDALSESERFLVGIVGFPGAGKSTLAEQLVAAVNQARSDQAAVVPMDGYHLPNERLDDLQLRPLKGIPETFDADAFVGLLAELSERPPRRVLCPAFDRTIDEPIADAIMIEPHHRLLVIEGNYLLLPSPPWNEIADLLDEAWYIDVPMETIMPRLIERHIKGGRDAEAARQKMESTDLRNARLIATTQQFADRLINIAT
jgi:pantothenate kinase